MDIVEWINENQNQFTDLSDQIWDFAETGYKEFQSAKLLAEMLEKEGFVVQRGIAGIPTAFLASYGNEKPVISLLGEYDALPGLSQKVSSEQSPILEGGNGHGCGHNLLGVGSLAAALAVKQAIQAGDVKGTVRYYGCPAEENGSGKAFMVKAGVFDDVDISLTWHPSMFNGNISMNLLANNKLKFKFFGTASHAAADPHNGRSALDAVELMNVAVNYLREHIISDARIHYVILNGGGIAPNIVPPYAESLYIIRAPTPGQLKPIYDRVVKIAKAASMMTETRVEIEFVAGASNLVYNGTVAGVLDSCMNEIRPPVFTNEEKQFAGALARTFPKDDNSALFSKIFGKNTLPLLKLAKEELLFSGVLPTMRKDITMPGSSDVGDVSWKTPTGQISTTCYAFGTPGHSWQLVAQGGMSIGHKGMLYAAQVLAASTLEFLRKPELVEQAQREFSEFIEESPYEPIIPEDVNPPV